MLELESPLQGFASTPAVEGHPVWGEIAEYFGPDEFRSPWEMDVAFLRWLWRVRDRAGVPIHITSDVRPQDSTVGADLTAHKKIPCRAIDGQVRDEQIDGRLVPASECLARIYIAAVLEGGVRFGTYRSSKGLGDIYHLDCETHHENPSPRWWTKW